MALTYKVCAADNTIPDYICNPCGEPEMGGVRGVAYIDKSLKSLLIETNLKDIGWWATQINSGLIHVIPSTRGTFDGGAKITTGGFGDEKETITGKNFTLVMNDRNHKENQPFYQALENNFKNYIPAFRTGSELRVARDVLTGLEVKDNVEEDVESSVLWNATATWKQNVPNTLLPIYKLTDEVKELFSNCIDDSEPEP